MRDLLFDAIFEQAEVLLGQAGDRGAQRRRDVDRNQNQWNVHAQVGARAVLRARYDRDLSLERGGGGAEQENEAAGPLNRRCDHGEATLPRSSIPKIPATLASVPASNLTEEVEPKKRGNLMLRTNTLGVSMLAGALLSLPAFSQEENPQYKSEASVQAFGSFLKRTYF